MMPRELNERMTVVLKKQEVSDTNWRTGADPGFGQGGPQLLRPKVVGWTCPSKVSYLQRGWKHFEFKL